MAGTAPKNAGKVAADHNRVLNAAYTRINSGLEKRLADVIQPILERAGQRAAAAFARTATHHLTAAALREADREALGRIEPSSRPGGFGYRLRPFALMASAPSPDSTMICLKPRPDEAAALSIPGGEPAETLHVTLVYLGGTVGPLTEIRDALAAVAATHGPLSGVVGGVGRFQPPGVAILLPDVPGLVELRVAVTEALTNVQVDYGRDHGFEAHISVDAAPDPDTLEEALARTAQRPLHFDAILVVRGDEIVQELPLVGVLPITAAGGPGWTAPAADEILDVNALMKEIRRKTDPVRNALVRASMTPTLGDVGVKFDVTNPLVAKVLAQSGSQIRGIAETTQLNVMRIIDSAIHNGLSIPETASLIRAGMTTASESRATTIARTELAGAANGGSLAAAQLVSGGTDGPPLYKQWLTAEGAVHPRHEDYDGLDGQTVSLDAFFDVGGNPFQFPGDPDGAPEDSINCFPGGTLVRAPGLTAAFRREYEGDLVRVEVRGVGYLSGTPNHPVLTSSGWKPLGLLREGDNLVRALPREALTSGDPDVDHAPAAIEQVFRALAAAKVPRRVRGRVVQFHGDAAADSEVEVVAADRDLWSGLYAARTKEVRQDGLSRTSEREAVLTGGGLRDDLSLSRTGLPSRDIRGGGQTAPLISGALSHPNSHRVGTSARRDPDGAKFPLDDTATDGVTLGQRLYGGSFEVALTKVISVKRLRFQGEVFNLQTETGTYIAGGIISHNCRCALAYTEEPPEDITGGSPGAGLSDAGVSTEGTTALDDAMPLTPPPDDDVSVMFAPFVPPHEVDRIKEFGLDLPLRDLKPTTAEGREIFAKAPTTEGLYKPGGHYLPDGTYTGGSWTEERTARHLDIIDAHFAGKTPPTLAEGEKPTAIFTAGGSASGKGGTILEIGDRSFPLSDLEKDSARVGSGPEHDKLVAKGDEWAIRGEAKYPDVILMNPDIIKELLPEYESLKDARDLYAASGVHEESSAIGKDVARLAEDRGYHVVFDTTGASNSFLGKLETAVQDGYDVKVRMVSIPTNEAIVRSMTRGDKKGRYVSIQALKQAHRGASAQLSVWKDSPIITDWKLEDNTEGRRLIAEGGNGRVVIHDQEKWDEILAKANETSAVPGSTFGRESAVVEPAAPPPPDVATLVPGPSAETLDDVARNQAVKFDAWAASYPVGELGDTVQEIRDTYAAKVDDVIAQAVVSAPVQIRMESDVLGKLLDDGRFKSQFEANRSRGLLDPEYRKRAENTMFGYPDDLKPELRPIYGYLGGSTSESGSVEQYGAHTVALKDSVRDRTTFTLTDSLGAAGSRHEISPVALIDGEHPSRTYVTTRYSGDPLKIGPDLEGLSEVYAEAQVHGGVSLDDVAAVTIRRGSVTADLQGYRDTVSYYESRVEEMLIAQAGSPSRNRLLEGTQEALADAREKLTAAERWDLDALVQAFRARGIKVTVRG